MRRNKELVVLLLLLAGAMGFVLWYVIDRRAREKAQAATPAAVPAVDPTAPDPTPAKPVAIQDRKTIDFSGGKAVVKDDPENKAAIDAAVADMQAALKEVSFDPPKKAGAPAPAASPPPGEPAPEKKP